MATTAAVACLRVEIPAIASLTDDQVAGLGGTCAGFVEGYAPNAPAPLKREGVIRLAAYLFDSRTPRAHRAITVGPLKN